ncbi:unnamed protein product [[Candida] boidinii]|uniref:Unnamed protein product n=1 Tax=Candida boidinii TaxID=5477 RepID=A0ACB5TSA6_CANBO|nr:unnamed protein product [[Candida] boidinii]
MTNLNQGGFSSYRRLMNLNSSGGYDSSRKFSLPNIKSIFTDTASLSSTNSKILKLYIPVSILFILIFSSVLYQFDSLIYHNKNNNLPTEYNNHEVDYNGGGLGNTEEYGKLGKGSIKIDTGNSVDSINDIIDDSNDSHSGSGGSSTGDNTGDNLDEINDDFDLLTGEDSNKDNKKSDKKLKTENSNNSNNNNNVDNSNNNKQDEDNFKKPIDFNSINDELNDPFENKILIKQNLDDSIISKSLLESSRDSIHITNLESFINHNNYNYDLNDQSKLNSNSIENLNCNNYLKYDSPILNSNPINIKESDMIGIFNEILKISQYNNIIKSFDESLTFNPSHWFKFSGSSIWLKDEKVHLMVSRVAYSPTIRNNPIISFLILQIYNPDLIEIKNKRLMYNNILKNDLDRIKIDYRNTKDESLLDIISIKFPKIIEIDNLIINTELPKGPEDPRIILKESNKDITDYDPIIIFNMLDGTSTTKEDELNRSIFYISPLQKPKDSQSSPSYKPIKFYSNDIKFNKIEKNWTPFFDNLSNSNSNNLIHFIYNSNPLIILDCNLQNGECIKSFKDDSLASISDSIEEQFQLRGGTQLISISKSILISYLKLINDNNNLIKDKNILNLKNLSKDFQIWVGFLKSHINNCGCGSNIYRPNLILLIKSNNIYNYQLISNSLDFGIDVLSWNLESTNCEEGLSNILTPNSIAFWQHSLDFNFNFNFNEYEINSIKNKIKLESSNKDKNYLNILNSKLKNLIEKNRIIDKNLLSKDSSSISNKNSNPLIFNDLMGLSITQADSTNDMILINGLLRYILNSIQFSDLLMTNDIDVKDMNLRNSKLSNCMIIDSVEYCSRYAKDHSNFGTQSF